MFQQVKNIFNIELVSKSNEDISRPKFNINTKKDGETDGWVDEWTDEFGVTRVTHFTLSW